MATGSGTSNRYGIKNTFRPTFLVPNPYGWTTAPQYNRADVPTAWVDQPSDMTQEELAQQFAYEWLESHQVGLGYSNPPFVSGAAGRLHPLLRDANGQAARILRGYIRRAAYDVTDPVSKARLYFMYNPETITREYVSYLDQGALDPFNTVFQSGNLVAPPSFMNFRFDLFFDRQEEAVQKDHPGVFVDYQFFDLVVRNVIPQDPNQTSNTLPDNGVMMVNPRDITVVFSPQITVQGRPINASVVFEKFTHRMTPIRMRISLEIRVIYFGPLREMTEYKMSQVEFISTASVPVDASMVFDVTYTDLVSAASTYSGATGLVSSTTPAATNTFVPQVTTTTPANSSAAAAALAWAVANVVPGQTRYMGATSGSHRWDLPRSADCSGLVWAGFRGIGQHTNMGWPASYAISSTGMIDGWEKSNWRTGILLPHTTATAASGLQPGDILVRRGHVVFFQNYESGRVGTFGTYCGSCSPQVGHSSQSPSSILGNFSHFVRPQPIGAATSARLV